MMKRKESGPLWVTVHTLNSPNPHLHNFVEHRIEDKIVKRRIERECKNETEHARSTISQQTDNKLRVVRDIQTQILCCQ